MIKFIQHQSPKYPPRTYENASADATIAFAFDFNTPGERLTKDAVKSQGKIYIPVKPGFFDEYDIHRTVLLINKATTLNIAGNGVYTTIKYDFSQDDVDEVVYDYLYKVFNHQEYNASVTLIRSGGQSGFDEAGLKAAVKLGIPALCVCPQGWKFMDENGTTICDENKFKNRFNGVLIL